ncbi:SHOCT domain-containing protein, partial [Propioniciclava flava]
VARLASRSMVDMTPTHIPLHMGGPGFFFLPMLIPLLLIGAALFLLLRKGRLGPVRFAPGARGRTFPAGRPFGSGYPTAEDEALARLAERLANGDITPEEYLERSSVLRRSTPTDPSAPSGKE